MSLTSAQTPTETDRLRWLAPLCAITVALVTAYMLAGIMWASVPWRLVTDGAACAAWLLGAAGYGAWMFRASRISCASRALTFCTSAAVGLGLESLVILGLGLAGLLNRPVALGMVGLGIAMGIAFVLTHKPKPVARHGSESLLWLLIAPTVGVAITAVFVLPGMLWGFEPLGYDALEYHLQLPREWFELGRVVPLSHNVFSYFPFNVEMHSLLAMHLYGRPWAGMYLAQLMHLSFVALTVASVYGIVRSLTSRVPAILAALLAAAVPWMVMLGTVAYNEGGLLFFGTLALGWTMLASQSDAQRVRMIALAGAMAGFACGTKLTAVPMLLLAVPIGSIMFFKRQSLKPALAFLLAGLVTLSPWLIRNTVWIGNPVFPEATSVFGPGHFDRSQVERWKTAHAPRSDQHSVTGRAVAFWNAIPGDWRFGFALFPLGVAAMVLGRRKPIAQFLMIVLAIQLTIWLGFTHLQGRFFVLAIPIVAMLAGLIEERVWTFCVGAGVIVCAVIGLLGLAPVVRHANLTIDSDDYRQLIDQSMFKPGDPALIFNHRGPVILVGEARAFEYDVPMRQLRYRTVFDIPSPNGSALEAWAGGSIPPDALLVFNPPEIRRLEQTYANLPKLPAALVPEGDTPLVIRADQLPK